MSTITVDLKTIGGDVLIEEIQKRLDASERVLSDIEGEDLVEEINKRLLSGEIDAEDINIDPTAGGGIREEDEALEGIDTSALDEAAVRFARRDYSEALWNLEKALGPSFAGLGDIKLADR